MGARRPSASCRRPQSVLVLVYTAAGEVLLLKRRQPFAFWQSVTGSLDAEETHAAAARRELKEETGLSDVERLRYSGNERVFEIDPRWRHRYAPGITHNTEYEWRYRVEAPCAVDVDGSEHLGYCWAPLVDAIDAVWSWTNKAALTALRDAL